MAQPTAYDRQYNFQDYQSSSPTSPLPGNQVEIELNAAKQTLDEILNNLALIQRDDGALANASVGRDQLAANLTVGFDAPTPWATLTAYTTTSTVYHEGIFYNCLIAHTSGTFATDLAALKWTAIANFNTIASLSGIRFAFDNSIDTDSEPATGTFRINNAAPASGTELAFHINSGESGNPDVSAFFDRWAAGTTNPKGQLYITKVGQGANRIEYSVIDVVDEGDFYSLVVEDGALAGSFADGDECNVLFVQGNDLDTSNLLTINFSNASGTLPADHIDATILNGLNPIGVIKEWPFASLPDANWLWTNGESIGDVGSGADHEHADYETLFNLCKAVPGLGNTGSEVWASGHTVNLPNDAEVFKFGIAGMGGISTSNTIQVSTTMQTDGDTTIVVASATGLAIGMYVLGAGIPDDATITAISGTTITISDAATTTAGPGTAVRFSFINDPSLVGATGGSQTHTLAEGELPVIDMDDHMTDPGHEHDEEGLNVSTSGQGGASFNIVTANPTQSTSTEVTGITFSTFGGGLAHSNIPPAKGTQYIILARRSALSVVPEIGFGGRIYKYSTSQTDAAPGDGWLRLDAALASAAEIWIDDDDGEGTDISGALQALTIGHLELRNLTQPGKFARYTIDATATDETGYVEIDITFEAGSGHADFANGDQVQLVYQQKGATGATGPQPDIFVQNTAPATTGATGSLWIDADSTDLDVYTLSVGDTWDDTGVNLKGATGPTGATGADGGHSFLWNTATSGDPGAGALRGNAAQASISSFAIDDVDADAANVETLIQAIDNSDSSARAHVRVEQANDRTKWVVIQIDGAFSDQSGYWTATASVAANGGTIDNGAAVRLFWSRTGDKGDTGEAGPVGTADDSVRVAVDSNIDLANDAADGDTLGGETVATGDLVLFFGQSASEDNGVKVIQASGAPVRDDDWDTWDEHLGRLVTVQEGDYADSIFQCTVEAGGTLETTALTFERRYGSATTTNQGVVELATDAEAIAKADTARALTPDNLAALGGPDSFAGLLELATAAEVITGTDTARATTAAGVQAKIDKEIVYVPVVLFDSSEDVTAGSHDLQFHTPAPLNGYDLVSVYGAHDVVSSTDGAVAVTTVQIVNVTDTADMLSTELTIDEGELTSATAVAAVIDATADDIVTGDIIGFDVDGVSNSDGSTVPKGLTLWLGFQNPA